MSILSTPVIRGFEDIGPYQILEDLGPAPFGSLYLAVDSRSDRRALLKVIPPSHPGALQESTPWEILLAETRSLFRIYHRGIPTLYELAEAEGVLLVAFEPVEGATLHEWLAAGERPDRATLIGWGCQLLDILAAAHAERIVHRHLNEDQIVVAPDGHLVLTGFGLTQLFFEPLVSFPPEHAPAEPPTASSDLYAVGVLLRRLAFAAALKGDPLLKVLARATFADPAARFQDAAEMAEALRQAGRSAVPALPAAVAAQREARVVRGPVAVPHPLATFTPRQPPSLSADEAEDRRFALLLVAAALLLMLTVIATGWFLIGHSTIPETYPAPVATGLSHAPSGPH